MASVFYTFGPHHQIIFMKKIILIPALILGATVYGQKGSWYLGGSAGVSMGDSRNGGLSQKRSAWNVSPEVGTFLTNNIQLGLGVGYGSQSFTIKDQSKTKIEGFGASIHSRYLFGENTFRPFLGVGVSYSNGSSITGTWLGPNDGYIDINGASKQQTFNASLTAGFFYNLSPRFSLYGSINVLGYNEMHSGGSVYRDLGFNATSTLGNRFSVGMYYTFKKGKPAE